MEIKVIITGVTGMVGEGVLFECLQNPQVTEVLIVGRKPYAMKHEKLKELIVPDFMKAEEYADQLKGYDACFFCAGISSVGMKEEEYTRITYDITLHFAKTLVENNTNMVFTYVSGSHTDSSEKGRIMWARVKGRTENALMRLPFKGVYNFRPGLMTPTKGQKNIKTAYKIIGVLYYALKVILPIKGIPLQDLGLAMINSVQKGYNKQILEIDDIKKLAKV